MDNSLYDKKYSLFKCSECGYVNNQSDKCVNCESINLYMYENTEKTEYFCPVCNVGIEIEQKNCCIFRCLSLKNGYVNPHASKEEIEQHFCNGNVAGGCGVPLRYVEESNKLEVILDEKGGYLYI